MSFDPSEDPDPVRPPRGPRIVEGVLAALLAMSLVANVVFYRRPPRIIERPAPAPVAVVPPPAPPPPECPAAVECPPAPPPCPTVAAPTGTGVGHGPGRGPVVPPEDLAMAQQGEGHIVTAADHAERDPIHRVAQRSVLTGVDQIVASRSPAAAERFLQRNLPSIASMDCAFRDPAMAEHVRMQLRPMNALARPANRLSEADLLRYERELRCPRE